MSEEEKTIEEQTETIIDAIETEDDVREAFEINKEDGSREALGAPLIRALGDPEPADMTMIHKHLDNFLAALCGETPVDTNVRTSTEYWLKRLADGLGGSTKKVYSHTISLWYKTGGTGPNPVYPIRISFYVVNDKSEAYASITDLIADYDRLPVHGILGDYTGETQYIANVMYPAGNKHYFAGSVIGTGQDVFQGSTPVPAVEAELLVGANASFTDTVKAIN